MSATFAAQQGLGQKTMAYSLPVVLPSDQSAISTTPGPSVVDTGNSTTTPLVSDAGFSGTGLAVLDYAQISILVFADQASAANGLSLQFSSDGTTWDAALTETIEASTGRILVATPAAKYFRVVYTNGGTSQTAFRLQTVLHKEFVFVPPSNLADATPYSAKHFGNAVMGRDWINGTWRSFAVDQYGQQYGYLVEASGATKLSFTNADYDTGAGTDNVSMLGIALPASGGAVAGGTTTNPITVQGAKGRGVNVSNQIVEVGGRATQTDWDGTIGGGTVGALITDDLGRLLLGGIATRALREKAHVQLADATETSFFAANANYRHDIVSWTGVLLSGTGVTLNLIEGSGGSTIASMRLTTNQPNFNNVFGIASPLSATNTNTALFVQLSGTGHLVNTYATGALLR